MFNTEIIDEIGKYSLRCAEVHSFGPAPLFCSLVQSFLKSECRMLHNNPNGIIILNGNRKNSIPTCMYFVRIRVSNGV